jgi:drug/metabolite transporter (DMT)-like permease
MSARFLDVSLLILLSALWGASYLFMRIAGPALGPVVLMAFRVSIAVVILYAYLGILRQWPDFRRYWKQFLLMGILNNAIPFLLIANAVIHLNASIAAILNATTPLFTAVVAAWWIKEPFGARKATGVVLGMVGVAVLVGWSPLPLTFGVIVAALQALLAALSYGLAAVHARRQFTGVAPLHAAVGQLTGSTAILLPLGVYWLPHAPPDARIALSVVGLAVACTALAYVMYFRLIATTGATAAATVTFLIPFFSVLWGVMFLGEPLSVGMFVGLGAILSSVWLVLGTRPA